MSRFSQSVGVVARNPYVQAFVGAVVLATGVSEIIDTFGDGNGVGAHHGVALVGLWHLVKAFAEIGESMEHVYKASVEEAAAE